jgi:hypothetical protein
MFPFLKKIPPSETYDDFSEPDAFKLWMKWAVVIAAIVCVVGVLLCVCFEGCGKGAKPAPKQPAATEQKPARPAPDLNNPVREAPASFPRNSNMPRGRETVNSGAINLATFDAKRDLVRFEDSRVWFNSDHKPASSGHEDDHLINRAMEVPLKRLVNLVDKKKGKLKVQDAYRPAEDKIHMQVSLHCEGRAIDLTCENLSLSELAKLCWQAGFDFVLYETPKASGEHVHCSVKREATESTVLPKK